MTAGGKALEQLSAALIGQRINKHLKRMEADPEINPVDPKHQTRPFSMASAHGHGSSVRICYVSYHGGQSLTKRDAAHYLGMLESGFTGTHWDAFENSPPPAPDLGPIIETVLVQPSFGGPYLFQVTRTTNKRMYGPNEQGRETWVDRSRVLRRNAGPAHLLALKELEAANQADLHALRERFKNARERILKAGAEDVEAIRLPKSVNGWVSDGEVAGNPFVYEVTTFQDLGSGQSVRLIFTGERHGGRVEE